MSDPTQNISMERAIPSLLALKIPTRIVILVRPRSPLARLRPHEIITKALQILSLPTTPATTTTASTPTPTPSNPPSRFGNHPNPRYLATRRNKMRLIHILDIYHPGYHPLSGHIKLDLPTLTIDFRFVPHPTLVKIAGDHTRHMVNHHVACVHNLGGWAGVPPFYSQGRFPLGEDGWPGDGGARWRVERPVGMLPPGEEMKGGG